MIKLDRNDRGKIAPLFALSEEGMIYSYLHGYMGEAWADSIEKPKAAQILAGDFSFFAGDSTSVEAAQLVKNIPSTYKKSALIMVGQDESWGELIKRIYKSNCKQSKRYGIKKEMDCFDVSKLKANLSLLPLGYELTSITEPIYQLIEQETWSYDFCSQFDSYKDFKQRGLGFVIMHSGELVCGASSYMVFEKGIEIEIDTKAGFRRMGLALVCASKLILECLNHGIYPSWDAANLGSVSLAEKLGYHYDKEYDIYIVKEKMLIF